MNKEFNKVKLDTKIKKMLSFYIRSSGSVEVIANEVVERVWFIKMPFFNFFHNELKTRFRDTVDRSSLRNKLIKLLENIEPFINICKIGYNIDQTLKNIWHISYWQNEN